MKRPELITLRNTLLEYHTLLRHTGGEFDALKKVDSVVEHLEQFVNRMPHEGAPESTIVEAAVSSAVTKEELSVRLGLILAKNVPNTFGYMLLVFGGGDQKMQFVTTITPQASAEMMKDFIKQFEPKI